MKVEEVTSRPLEARMHVADRADGNVASAQADSFRAAAAAPVKAKANGSARKRKTA